MAEKVCYPWEKNWAESMPDFVVKKAVERGVINPDCLPEDRRIRLGLEKKGIKLEEELAQELAKEQ